MLASFIAGPIPIWVHVSCSAWRSIMCRCFGSPRKGAQQPLTFRAMSIVAKQSPISATAELLLSLNVTIISTLRIIIIHTVTVT